MTFFAKTGAPLTTALPLQVQRNGRIPEYTVADWLKISSSPGAKEHVANLCQIAMLFGIVSVLLSQAFAAWRGWGAESAARLLAGCPFLRLSWQWILLSRLGVTQLSFVSVSWCVVCFLGSHPPVRRPWLLAQQLCGSDCVCRPEFNIIRLKNSRIYLKADESFVHLGEEFRFHDSSRFRRLEMQNFGFTTVLSPPVFMSLVAASCRSRAESEHLLKPHL